MKLPLAYYGDPILRKKSVPVTEITAEIRQLVQDMIETMFASNGMGLAAPQVHHSLTLFVTSIPLEGPDGKLVPGPVKIYINPKLSEPSDELWEAEEACLSIPKLYGHVYRPLSISVEAMGLDGGKFKEHLVGLEARCVMHENDHINGVLYIDRLSPEEKKMLEVPLRDVKNRYYLKK